VFVEALNDQAGWFHLTGDAATLTRHIRDAACESGVGILEIRGTERTLEEVVVEAMA
jgi:hypothetical protein